MAHTTDLEAELAACFADIARQLQAEDGREATWAKIITLARHFLPEIEHGAISLVRRNNKVDTVAATDEVARSVDRIQYETGEGPCLSSIWEHEMFVTGDLATECRWPVFSSRTLKETGVRSMLAFQLFVQEDTLGALNLYSQRQNAFGERAQAFGRVLAAHAALAMSAAEAQDAAENLQTALESSREIGVAIGILMVQSRVDQSGAFRILVDGSQRTNVKIRTLAERIVAAETERNVEPRAPRLA